MNLQNTQFMSNVVCYFQGVVSGLRVNCDFDSLFNPANSHTSHRGCTRTNLPWQTALALAGEDALTRTIDGEFTSKVEELPIKAT